MKAKDEENKKPKEAAAGKKKNTPAVKGISEENASELDAPRWSVVSFESRLANHLTYAEAARKLAEFKGAKVAGLCIITDEAAARVGIRQ